MSDEQQQIYERMEGEPSIWFRRFERYRLMEPVRSVAAVFNEEQGTKNDEKVRNNAPGKWYEIAKEWHWEERAAAWDALVDEELEKTIQAEKKQVLRKNFALMHKRVEELDRLAQKLIDYTKDEEKIWLLDVKAIGSGPGAERVDLVQFNDALFREIRAHLTDIASEMGERVKTVKQEVTGKDGGPLATKNESTDDLSEEDLQLIVQLAAELKAKKEQDGQHS